MLQQKVKTFLQEMTEKRYWNCYLGTHLVLFPQFRQAKDNIKQEIISISSCLDDRPIAHQLIDEMHFYLPSRIKDKDVSKKEGLKFQDGIIQVHLNP